MSARNDEDPLGRSTDVRAVEDVLDRAAHARKAEMDAVIERTTAHDRDVALRTVRGLAGERARVESPLRRRKQQFWIAAALLVGFGLAVFLRGGESDPTTDRAPKGYLEGDAAKHVLVPTGEVDANEGYPDFSWTRAERDEAGYRLEIWNRGATDFVVELPLGESRYRLSDGERARLGPEIEWQVWRIDQDGRAVSWGRSSASLSSR